MHVAGPTKMQFDKLTPCTKELVLSPIKRPVSPFKKKQFTNLLFMAGNVESAHVVLQRKIIRRNSRDLKHIYELLKQHMKSEFYQYIDKAFSLFSHNLRIIGFNKGG